jgi:hypothetical protein
VQATLCFAQAVEGGEPWWLTADEERQLDERNTQHIERAPWETPILRWAEGRNWFTTEEVLRCAVGVTPDKQTKLLKNRVSAILLRAGFVAGKHGPPPQRWCWRNPKPPDDPAPDDDPSPEVLIHEWERQARRERERDQHASA